MNQNRDLFRIIQRENIVESINQLDQVFHFIDLDYLNQGIIYHGWIGYRTNGQIRQVLDGHFIDIYLKHKCRYMLIDDSKMSGSFADVNNWLATYFMPKMIDTGLQYCAVVFPQEIFAQLAVEDWDNKVGGFTTRNFRTVDEALAWLRSL